MSIPALVEQEIVNYCGRTIYERGKQYLALDKFYVFYKDGMSIKAICQGTVEPSYSVKVVFDDQGILAAQCTCYRNNFGSCKHTAALLLLWCVQPEQFVDKNRLAKIFGKIRKAQLIQLLEDIVIRYPEVPQKYSY